MCYTRCYMAEQVGVRELRQNLSRWLRRVGNGESFEVTERGTPVAMLTPLPPANSALARLVAQGRIARLAQGNLADLGPPPPRAEGEPSLSEILDELREDRF
jgi:prevent-host-death family protein